MHGRLGQREALLVRTLLLLLRWVLEMSLPDSSVGDLEQGGGELLAQAHDQFSQVLAAASFTTPSAGAAPSTPTAAAAGSCTAPTGVRPAASTAEPPPEPGSPTRTLSTVFATSGSAERREGRYHRISSCKGFRSMGPNSVVLNMTEQAALLTHLSRCQLCYAQPWTCVGLRAGPVQHPRGRVWGL